MVTKKKRYSVSLSPQEESFLVNLSKALDKPVSETIRMMIQRSMSTDNTPRSEIEVPSPNKVLVEYLEILEVEKKRAPEN